MSIVSAEIGIGSRNSLSLVVSTVTIIGLLLVEVSYCFGYILNNKTTLRTDRRVYFAKLEPGFTGINIKSHFWNERIVRFQVHCLFYGRQCDLVGKWAKRKSNTI